MQSVSSHPTINRDCFDINLANDETTLRISYQKHVPLWLVWCHVMPISPRQLSPCEATWVEDIVVCSVRFARFESFISLYAECEREVQLFCAGWLGSDEWEPLPILYSWKSAWSLATARCAEKRDMLITEPFHPEGYKPAAVSLPCVKRSLVSFNTKRMSV
ncbi:hypothetical protein LY76DRAFT_594063 [Colletotrichum caudatum]|nr:hypothetical protein LY76DRAFT_594063 [Colletotrichum caudatum]